MYKRYFRLPGTCADTTKHRFSRLGPARVLPVMAGLAMFLATALTGCGEARDRRQGGTATTSGPDDHIPRRIVCGAPSVTEIVFALDCGDRVVGVSDYTVYPPEAKAKERIGGWINPSRERLLVLKPDIIITQGQHETLAGFAREYGIRFLTLKLDTLEDIHAAIESIAEALGVPERGEALSGEIRREIGALRAKVADAPPKRVLLLFDRAQGRLSGLATVGPGTFLDDLIRVAGGSNIFADARGAYPQVSKESLLVRRPEAIIEVYPGGLEAETVARLRADWQEFADIPAVRNNRIHYLTNDFMLIPGPRVGLIAEALAKAIVPEAFRE